MYSRQQFEQAKLRMEMEKKRHTIRRESIVSRALRNSIKHRDVRRRVFENDDITTANAKVQSTQASKEALNSMAVVQKSQNMIKNYYQVKSKIES